jgi:hypothetical protein
MPNHIQITVNGNTYNNVRAAWRAESPDDLPEITVRKRLKAGWVPEAAFSLSPITPTQRRLGYMMAIWNRDLLQ